MQFTHKVHQRSPEAEERAPT